MLVNLARNGSLRTLVLVHPRCPPSWSRPSPISGTSQGQCDPKTWPYDVRLTARGLETWPMVSLNE